MLIKQCIINNLHNQKRNHLNAFICEYLRLFLMSVNAAGGFFGSFFSLRLSAESVFSDAH